MPAHNAKRSHAEALAMETLQRARAAGRKVTVENVEAALELWAHSNDATCQDVEVDHHLSLGLVLGHDAKLQIAEVTSDYPCFTELIARWITDQMPVSLGKLQFPFTSIDVYDCWQLQRRRDLNSMGPSLIRSLGSDIRGGRLQYFPGDMDTSTKVQDLNIDDRVAIDVHREWVLFDARRCHEFEKFEGRHFVIVAYCNSAADSVSVAMRNKLFKVGLQCPTAKQMSDVQEYLAKAIPGYRSFSAEEVDNEVCLPEVDHVTPDPATLKQSKIVSKLCDADPATSKQSKVASKLCDVTEATSQAKQATHVLLEAKFDRTKVTTNRLPVGIYRKNVTNVKKKLECVEPNIRSRCLAILAAMDAITNSRRTSGPWMTQFMRGPWKKYALGVFRLLGGSDEEMVDLMRRYRISSAEVADACRPIVALDLPTYLLLAPASGSATCSQTTKTEIGDFILYDNRFGNPRRGLIAIDTNRAGEMAEFQTCMQTLDDLIEQHADAGERQELARIADFMCAGRGTGVGGGFGAERGFDSKTVGTWRRFLILMLYTLKLETQAAEAMRRYCIRQPIVDEAEKLVRSKRVPGKRSPIFTGEDGAKGKRTLGKTLRKAWQSSARKVSPRSAGSSLGKTLRKARQGSAQKVSSRAAGSKRAEAVKPKARLEATATPTARAGGAPRSATKRKLGSTAVAASAKPKANAAKAKRAKVASVSSSRLKQTTLPWCARGAR
eukprot:TRINITY_DN22505_c0_g1_i1.p1 TRINITY_DN22505_c0_g1~~TRINITY_DN22505_c0_g1_i1.p1  ORF type:complete len:722 (+),score=137.85 TRINITY_DN22505_c0_g1_i1:34-2199(+)